MKFVNEESGYSEMYDLAIEFGLVSMEEDDEDFDALDIFSDCEGTIYEGEHPSVLFFRYFPTDTVYYYKNDSDLKNKEIEKILSEFYLKRLPDEEPGKDCWGNINLQTFPEETAEVVAEVHFTPDGVHGCSDVYYVTKQSA